MCQGLLENVRSGYFFHAAQKSWPWAKGPYFSSTFTMKFDECTLSAAFKPVKAVCVMDGRTLCILCLKENQFVIRPKA